MNAWLLIRCGVLLAEVAPSAPGGSPADPGAQPQPQFGQPLILMVILFGAFYFLMIRPQRRKEKERQLMLSRIQEKDRVITNGGIHGQVVRVDKDEITLRIDARKDVQIKISRNYLVRVQGAEGDDSDSSPPAPPPS